MTYVSKKTGAEIDDLLDQLESNVSKSTLHRLFVGAGGTFNSNTGYWEMNGITDLTNTQMAYAFAQANMWLTPTIYNGQFAKGFFRTNFWNKGRYDNLNAYLISTFRDNANLEVLALNTVSDVNYNVNVAGNMITTFYGCTKLKKILGILNVSNATSFTSCFTNCQSLESLSLKGLKASISFANSPNLNKNSLLYLINNANPKSNITIQVNKSVYTWASTDSAIESALTNQPYITLITTA